MTCHDMSDYSRGWEDGNAEREPERSATDLYNTGWKHGRDHAANRRCDQVQNHLDSLTVYGK